MTLVAISASYGAGGTRIGQALAERLGVPFLDRAIPLAVAAQLDVPLDEAAAHDEQAGSSWLDRILRGFVAADTGTPAPLVAETFSSNEFKEATERVLLRQAATGEGVILGRGAVVLLRSDPGVLRVRLDGPVEDRVRQGAEHQGVDEAEAERTLRRLDRTHEMYIRQFYGLDICSPSLYHVWLDSTALPKEDCVEMLAQAAQALVSRAAADASR